LKRAPKFQRKAESCTEIAASNPWRLAVDVHGLEEEARMGGKVVPV